MFPRCRRKNPLSAFALPLETDVLAICPAQTNPGRQRRMWCQMHGTFLTWAVSMFFLPLVGLGPLSKEERNDSEYFPSRSVLSIRNYLARISRLRCVRFGGSTYRSPCVWNPSACVQTIAHRAKMHTFERFLTGERANYISRNTVRRERDAIETSFHQFHGSNETSNPRVELKFHG